jgi:hypothetical protein
MENKAVKKIMLLPLLLFLPAYVCVADTVRVESAKHFAEEIQRSLPFTTLTALAWPDSYIGQIVSRKPHFGLGISYGMSTVGFPAVREMLDSFATNGYMNMAGVFVPPLYAQVRIGGFFVPFDIGVVASIPLYAKPADGVTTEQQTLGSDIRFALVRDGPKLPGISLGIAYTQTTGYLLTGDSGSDISTIYWSGNVIEIKTQISKTFGAFTPYFGGGGSFTWTQAGYDYAAAGMPPKTYGMKPDNFANGILFRMFGGVSIKLWMLRLDLGINVSPPVAYGATVGIRFQL